MNEIKAINVLQMTVREAKRLTIDAGQWLAPAERIIGITSITLTPSGGPMVSASGYSQDGKSISFLATAVEGTTTARQYEVSTVLSVSLAGLVQTVEARATLLVVS